MTEIWPKQKKSRKVSTRDQTGDLLHVRQMWYSLHHANFIWRELAYKYINHFMYMYFYVFNFRNAFSIAKAQKQLFLFNFFCNVLIVTCSHMPFECIHYSLRGLSQITFTFRVGRWSEKRVVYYIKSAN